LQGEGNPSSLFICRTHCEIKNNMVKFKSSYRLGSLVAAGVGVLIGIVLFLKVWKGMPSEHLTRDPNAIFDAPLYIGFLSQVGIFFWASAAAVCLYSGALLAAGPSNTVTRGFLYSAGLLSMLLGLDDAFLLHEQFFPFIGIPEKVVYVIYASLMLCFLFRFRTLILRTEYPMLAAGLLLFSASVLLDVIQPEGIDVFLVEDTAKIAGIMSWLAYFSHAAYSCSISAFSVRGQSAVDLTMAESERDTLPQQVHAQCNSSASYRKRASLVS
jgi:hypothetical protein